MVPTGEMPEESKEAERQDGSPRPDEGDAPAADVAAMTAGDDAPSADPRADDPAAEESSSDDEASSAEVIADADDGNAVRTDAGDDDIRAEAEAAEPVPAEPPADDDALPSAPRSSVPPQDEPSALEHTGASQLPPAPVETIEAVAAAVGRLRAEVAATADKSRRARLLNEAAEIQERGADESGAARDYLGAYNSDTRFREPLEGLVRLLERRRSLSNVGKLIEALVATSSTPEERARALTQRAIFSEDVQNDLEGARGAAREATETGAIAADLGAAWLALEMVAAKLGDGAQREEALAGRAELTHDPEWRGLLLADVARLAAAGGDVDRALEVLARARSEGGAAAFQASVTTEQIVRADPGLAGEGDARARQRELADALEARAEMVHDAISDARSGDARGVPRHCRNIEHLVDLLMRAADARCLASEIGHAAQLLDRALEVIAESTPSDEEDPTATGDAGRETAACMERAVVSARLRVAELAGDTARAAELAERRAVGETDGGVAASLAMRVAEHAASEGDIANALVALSRATERDPTSAPARALKIDMLGGGADAPMLATELEELARHYTTNEARGRALVLAAYVWAARAESSARARGALDQAATCGLSSETIARLGRSLASLRSDHEWYEEATRALVAQVQDSSSAGGAGASELPLLWIELARMRLAQGDEAGAAKATAALRDLPAGTWLGRVLDGLASPDIDPVRARSAIEELAAQVEDPSLGRSLRIVCALRARAAGDEAGAIAHLEALARDDATDPLVTAYLGDLLRIAGDRAAAERLRLARESATTGADETAAAAKAWFDAGGGAAAAMEWLASAMASGDPAKEVPARRALAELASDESREALHAGATLLASTLAPDEPQALVLGSSHAARLANLELSPPGCDPRRRASTLSELDTALGEDTEHDALGLAGWSAFAAGDATTALDLFRTVTANRAEDLHAWEGVRTCAEALGDDETYATACEQLGARCAAPGRGGAFWEQAALAWLKLGADFEARAETALDASFARDATRAVAFDRLFRRVRERKDHDKLLALVDRRLEVTDDAQEIAKLYWEQARALREKGDPDGALDALAHVTTIDENHVGALALTGEIFIRRGMFEEAAQKLARLARVEAAPAKNRVTAGITAVDLYENKLGRYDLALDVLVALHQARLSTLPVRERLARAAARTGAWTQATGILEELMHERPERDGRIEAARLAMAIHRERRMLPQEALAAATKLLEEAPTDGEAIDLVLSLERTVAHRQGLLERARDALLMSLHEGPTQLETHRRLARVCRALGDEVLEQSALSCCIALGGPDTASVQTIALYAVRKPRTPQVALGETSFRQILASGDDGPIADLFVALGTTLGEALGPTRDGLQVTKKDRVDPKAGTALRSEIAQWAGAFGITTFDLYVGGKDPGGVQGIAGDPPAIVVGSGVNAPLTTTTRARLVRELVAIARGTTITRSRDDTTVATVVVAACNLTKVRVAAPPLPSLPEIERQLGKAISRKVKAAIEPICRACVASGRDARQWAGRARMTQARFATLACGDVSIVLADLFGEPLERVSALAREDQRAHELFRFALSRPYFDVRRSLGLEGQG